MFLLLLTATLGLAQATPQNWSGNYALCIRHHDLLESGHVNLGVRISTSNTELGRQFREAMRFWSQVLDIDWHEVTSENCAIQLVDGEPELFESDGGCGCMSARSQFPDRADFQGWIAFNPRVKLPEREMFMISVHEIGHLLGLHHNPRASSVMYFLGVDGEVSLDTSDLDALANLHALRVASVASIPIP